MGGRRAAFVAAAEPEVERVSLEVAYPVAELRLVLDKALRGAGRGAGAGGEEARREGPSCAISESDGVEQGKGLRALGGSGGDRPAQDGDEVMVAPHGGRPAV